jgi:hypothetical protein
LGQEFDGNRGIVPANLFDELTFVHVRYTFKMVSALCQTFWLFL